jgi:hypothetical protein
MPGSLAARRLPARTQQCLRTRWALSRRGSAVTAAKPGVDGLAVAPSGGQLVAERLQRMQTEVRPTCWLSRCGWGPAVLHLVGLAHAEDATADWASGRQGQLIECDGHPPVDRLLDGQRVVPWVKVLDERLPSDDDPGAAVLHPPAGRLPRAHRPRRLAVALWRSHPARPSAPCLEPPGGLGMPPALGRPLAARRLTAPRHAFAGGEVVVAVWAVDLQLRAYDGVLAPTRHPSDTCKEPDWWRRPCQGLITPKFR